MIFLKKPDRKRSSMRNVRAYFPAVVLLVAILGAGTHGKVSYAQVAADSHVAPWRLQAKQHAVDLASPITSQDAISRGAIVDSLIGVPQGYTVSDQANGKIRTDISGTKPSTAELPTTNSDIVAIANFASFSVIVTPSRRSLYTIANLKASNVISSKIPVPEGKVFPILELGGSAILRDAQPITFGVPHNEYSITPGHNYLVFLSYSTEGHFFTINKCWDVTTGSATPNSQEDERRLQEGTSTVAGKSTSDLIVHLQRANDR